MKKNNISFLDKYFFYPSFLQKLLAFALLPLSAMYYLIAIFRKNIGTKKQYDAKILSIGNLVSGGSGKTPFCIALAKNLEKKDMKIAVILRGYKRESKGLVAVKEGGKILCSVEESGDEAMLIAQSIKGEVIVSENRDLALKYVINKEINIVILDDAFRFRFQKFDILLKPSIEPYFNFVLPSGYYRFPKSFYKQCDLLLHEGIDYKRKTHIKILNNNENPSFILATAIAYPKRLDSYLPDNVAFKYYLSDHANFNEKILESLLKKYSATHILMTQKDYVKCEKFSIPIAILELDMDISSEKLEIIESYILD